MNTAQEHTESVVVTVTGCSTEDADAVFRALGRAYPSDRDESEVPRHVMEGHETVWTTTFDVSHPLGQGEPVRLAAPVTVEMQGGYWAVDRMKEMLATSFEVQEEGMAAGDQEKDVQLRLTSGIHQ
ncbi:hypothetical protein AB0K02_30820 [Streptomyces sp. NPDC049597]|uniref:hypothetical protein n=1 Tax=Streptomyces sp. NPDC049597 TaxID=3155276 RepID=UPI00343EA454